MIWIIETGGHQYKVSSGSVINIEKLEVEVGGQVTFDKVLLKANDDGSEVQIGVPYLEGEALTGEILEQGKGEKIRIIKFKKRNRYTKRQGHRQLFTKVKIA